MIYRGETTLYCVLGIAHNDDENFQSVMEIVDGGLGYTFIQLDTRSAPNTNLDYVIILFGKDHTKKPESSDTTTEYYG